MTKHNKKFDLYLIRYDFELVFDNDFKPHIKTVFYHKTTIIDVKGYILYWIDYFIERGCNISHIIKMNIKTNIDRRKMNYKYYINQPMQAALFVMK